MVKVLIDNWSAIGALVIGVWATFRFYGISGYFRGDVQFARQRRSQTPKFLLILGPALIILAVARFVVYLWL